MRRSFTCLLVAFLAFAPSAVLAVRMTNTPTGCTVSTGGYRLAVDVGRSPLVRVFTPDGRREVTRMDALWLRANGRRFERDSAATPHFHPVRSGRYLVELHLENVVLRDVAGSWPGLADVSLYCHEDRVYLVVAMLCPQKEWVNRGLYVYRAAEGHRACPPVSAAVFGFGLAGLGGSATATPDGVIAGRGPVVALRQTMPVGRPQMRASGGVATFERAASDSPWLPGSVHEIGAMLAFTASPARARDLLAAEAAPLPADAFTMSMGKCEGFDAERGVYCLTAVTSGTPSPPRGLRAGARFTVRGDGRARTVLIDQRDPWGGISGGILRDGAGEPIPVPIQFSLNFPELNAEAGEPGWAFLTYPLRLAAGERREVRAEHLYHALSDREVTYLNSLENIGDPLLLQVTVGGLETHTLTTGAYPGKLIPGNELRVNDFRRIYTQVRSRSASAVLPTFFGYWSADGSYQGLMPGDVIMRETSPFLTEYAVSAATRDGAVAGSVRVWEAPHADMTRIFTEVSLRVRRAVRLDAGRVAPLFFLRHHAFNPMAYTRYAYTQADGSARAGDLTHSRTVVAERDALGLLPFACLYRATNHLESNLACSDITGNPGFVVLDWDVRFGGKVIAPGCYVFCTGEGDVPDGAYARDIAVVPSMPVAEVPAGSTIRYRAVQMVFGDNASDHAVMARERAAWALHPLRAAATVGQVVSADPPEFLADRGRAQATISGGAGWAPIRVRGLLAGKRLHVRQADAAGSRELGPGSGDEPWYSAWPDAQGACGFTFLIHLPDGGNPTRLTVWQE